MLEIIITVTINGGCRREGCQLLGLKREEITINTSPAPSTILSEKSFKSNANFGARKPARQSIHLVEGNYFLFDILTTIGRIFSSCRTQ